MGYIKSCTKVKTLSGCHLLHYSNCFCSQKVRLCLEHKGIRWTSHQVDILKSENLQAGFFQINPRGLVPVLVHDGVTIVESTDIMIHIENSFRERPLKPNDQAALTEMKELLTLADSVQEAVFCLTLHFYYGNESKQSLEELYQLGQYCCTDRGIYEIYILHKDGFKNELLLGYMEKLHSCFAILESKLRQGRANLIGADRSLADYSWAPIVYQAVAMGVPMDSYPCVLMWFDIIEKSATFHRAVKAWENPWLKMKWKMRVRFQSFIGNGIEGMEYNYQPMIWIVPIIILFLLFLCVLCFPCHGIHYGVLVPRSLVLYILVVVLPASVLFAFKQSHQPRAPPEVTPRTQTMKALTAVDYGGPEVLRLSRGHLRPVLSKSTDVLVRVSAASVNPSDVKLSAGLGHRLFNFRRKLDRILCGDGKEFPIVLGRDFCGTVVEVGQDVMELELGQQVWGCLPAWFSGCQAEYVVVRAEWLEWKPANIQPREAAAVPYAGCVALQALEVVTGEHGMDLTGKKLLVHGCGGVGSLLVQIATASGAQVTVTCSQAAADNISHLCNVHKVINYRTHNFATLLENERFDLVVHTVATNEMTSASLTLTSPGGAVVTLVHDLEQLTSDYGVILGYMTWRAKTLKMKVKQRILHGNHYHCLEFDPKGTKRRLSYLKQLIEAGKVQPVMQGSFKSEEYHKAFKVVSSGHAHGKHIICWE